MKIPPFLLDQWLDHYHFVAATPPEFNLASSTGPHWTLGELLGLVDADEQHRLSETKLSYSSARGHETLRQSIAEMQGASAEQVQILTGASEALLILFCLAAEPGANVILPSPLFPSTAVLADLFGLETRFYHLRRGNDFSVDPHEIEKLTDDRTKLLFVNTPHNPTGATLSDEELRHLHDFAAARGIQFVSDEVYHPIYHGRETGSAAALPHATVLGGFSKSLSLSGLRVGWIVERDPARLQSYLTARQYFTISNSVLSEELGVIAIRHRETIFARTRKAAGANLSLLEQFFAEHTDQLAWVRPRGGMTAFPWLRQGGDAREFCRVLAEQHGVLLVPGDCFGAPDHFRLGFGVAEEGFSRGLERFADFLKTRGRAGASASRMALSSI
ncbi:MAG TPA: aminotransferase class I/II-fold pyridoxal phosphate-dependent enzyme [Pyrinomonadaceae bacterium]|jgi:aspartate/methionine/tyrosine aminotransferase|nr:aminotransferase class I/II-fold pyridoxal phosphate-dependent enzyme [Pyrinomonadaceae bacterium]